MPDEIVDWDTDAPELPDITDVEWSAPTPWISGTPSVVSPPEPDTVLTWQGPPGAAGPPGPGALIRTYSLVTVSSWTQVHTYAYDPAVTVIDATNEAVLIAVSYPDATHVHISFPAPFTGTVVLR